MDIRLDFSDVIDEFSLSSAQSEDMAKFVVEQVTQLIFNHWRGVAGRELKSTRSGYIQGLQIIEEGKLKNSIVLFGELNNMLEQGAQPWDIKRSLLSSSKAKKDKEGNPFVTVPFRFSVPGSLGENQAFSEKLPSEVYTALQQVKRQGQGDSLSQGNVPHPFNIPRTRKAIPRTQNTPAYGAYQHKVSVFAGLKQTGRQYHHQYKTFRRVSLNSDPDSWIHPGFDAYDLASKAINEADIPNAVETFVDKYINTL